MAAGVCLYSCLILVRPDTPWTWGCVARVYLDTSQKTFCQSMRVGQRPHRSLNWVLRPGVDHVADEILRNPVGRTVDVGELVPSQYRIIRPRRWFSCGSPGKDALPFGGEPPVDVETFACPQRAAACPELCWA